MSPYESNKRPHPCPLCGRIMNYLTCETGECEKIIDAIMEKEREGEDE